VEAARLLAPDYLLFTDADILHTCNGVARLVTIAERESRHLVSVMVRLNCTSPAERLLIPAFVFFFFMLYPPAWIRRADHRTAGAAGGCILIRPDALDRIGGIEAIRSELIDDCALARAVKRIGGSVWLGISDEVRSIRQYPAFGDVRRMIVRTAFTQLRYSPLLLLGTVAGMGLLYVVPVAASLAGSPFGALAWLTMAALYLPAIRFYRQPLLSAFLLPLAGVFYTAATLESAIRYWSGEGGAWKGRHQAVQS
jgi:hopene-associated glycosyltransferase HpnB